MKEDEPVEFALSTVKHVLNNIMDRFPEAQSRRVFLTGKNNFRDQVATIQEYKGNRDKSKRPHYYTDIRNYLIEHQGAEVIDGQEADDAQAIAQWACPDKSTVIVGIDKDLYGCPGFHYHWVKDELFYISLAQANKFFWKQVLTGDRTDNIPGIKGLGPKTADKIIDVTDGSWVAMEQAVQNEYKKVYGDAWYPAFHENATLIWMRREEGVNYDGKRM